MKDLIEQQEIREIPIKDLVLWTENPRDKISPKASNEEIIKFAIHNKSGNWNLKKLASEMGSFFDFSEIPIVVYKKGKPIVYDGNCRVILAILKLRLFDNISVDFELPETKDKIPCNVCSETVALQSIYRKHANNGSWRTLERDLFLFKFMNKAKSDFLILEESTHIISDNLDLNKDYVKNEVLSKSNLNKMGFKIEDGKFKSQHTKKDTEIIINDIVDIVRKKEITTRKNRGNVLSVLSEDVKKIIVKDKNNNYETLKISYRNGANKQPENKLKRRTQKSTIQFFGRKLILKYGIVNDLYRDILALYEYYCNALKTNQVSKSFIGIIRMALRLITETAAHKAGYENIDKYIYNNYSKAKEKLTKDNKTYLHENDVSEKSIVGLLNTGAHNYTSSLSIDKAIAMSIIIGEILEISYGEHTE